MNEDNIQAMRDQGIADALNGYPAFAVFHEIGELSVMCPDGFMRHLSQDDDAEWREAFAYAQAYAANI